MFANTFIYKLKLYDKTKKHTLTRNYTLLTRLFPGQCSLNATYRGPFFSVKSYKEAELYIKTSSLGRSYLNGFVFYRVILFLTKLKQKKQKETTNNF